METDYRPKEISGINLDDYQPKYRNYNSVVYVHKKCLKSPKKENTSKGKKEIENKEKKTKKKGRSDKCQQVDETNLTVNMPYETLLNRGLMGQTVHFAKTMVPVVIPPSGTMSPVYYTIKATKKSKRKPKADVSTHTHDITYKKERSKKIVETYRNDKSSQKESLSIKETTTYSSQSDTLDEIHINPSLCCTFSDVSDHKQVKKEKKDKPKHEHRLVPSESFEALATEFLNTSGDTKIKIHIMNETEKKLLSENIRQPLLNAIRECVLELNGQNNNTEISTVQKFVKCNTQKIDTVIDKLTCIEHKLDQFIISENAKQKANAQRLQISKASALENLEEDLLDIKEESSGDEYYKKPSLSARKRARGVCAVMQLKPEENKDMKEGLGGGEEIADSGPGKLVRPDKPNRMPARFCWTDAAKKNVS